MQNTVIFLHGQATLTSRHFHAGLTAFASEHGWTIREINPPPRANAAFIRHLADFWHPLGIIATYGIGQPMPLPPPDVKSPFICIDLAPKLQTHLREHGPLRLGFVDCDSEHIAQFAAKILLSHNCASYAYVSHSLRSHWSETRRRHFHQALELNGQSCRDFDGRNLASGTSEQVRRLGAWLAALPKPCGLLAANDRTASLVLNGASLEGIAVPDELSVIGIDNDTNLCEAVSPQLSSIMVDFQYGGLLAGKLIQQLHRGESGQALTACYGAQEFASRLSSRKLAQSSSSIRTALEVIRRRVTEGIGAADILPILGGSRRTAEKRFRAAVGKSILEEILDVRFERLMPLLESSDLALNMLAGKTGFSSDNHLQRLFKARFGMTLSAYRRKHARSPTGASTLQSTQIPS